MPDTTPQQELLRLVTGYWVSQAVYVAAELGLADRLAGGPKTAEELAFETGTNARPLGRLLRALATVGIFSEGDDRRYALTPLAEPLRSDVPGSQRAMVLMMVGQFYRAWGDLLGSVRTGRPVFEAIHGRPFFHHLADHPDQARVVDDAMTALNDRKTTAMLDDYDFSAARVVADVGGGNGGQIVGLLHRYPEARGVLTDLPGVADRASSAIAEAGLADWCRVEGGSFLVSVPAGADVYPLRHILHNWDDDQALAILRNVRRAVADTAGARLLVVERVIPPGNEPAYGKLMGLTMLVVHGGLERTEEEFCRLLAASGFRLSRVVPTAAEVFLIEGHPE
jgi:hypothetical protein